LSSSITSSRDIASKNGCKIYYNPIYFRTAPDGKFIIRLKNHRSIVIEKNEKFEVVYDRKVSRYK